MPEIAISGDKKDPKEPPKKLCARIRQEFVDCMFRHSECLKITSKTLPECIRLSKRDVFDDRNGIDDSNNNNGSGYKEHYNFPPECHKSFNLFLQCRTQVFDSRSRFRGYKEF